MGLMSKLLRQEAPTETPCPRCGIPAPADATECTACGWDLRESYHGQTPGGARTAEGRFGER
jgi:hypothetical protein